MSVDGAVADREREPVPVDQRARRGLVVDREGDHAHSELAEPRLGALHRRRHGSHVH